MESFELLPVAVIGFYFLGALFSLVSLSAKNERLGSIAGAWAVGGFALHTLDLGLLYVGAGKHALLMGGTYFNFVAWTLLALHLFLRWQLRSAFLSLAALPLALLLYAISLATSTLLIKVPPQLTGLFLGLHIASLAVALGLLALAFGAALAWMHLNAKLKSKAALKAMDTPMPSLEKFDSVNNIATIVGFPLYTLGIFSMTIWYWIDPERAFIWDATKFTALAAWLLYLALFHQRTLVGLKGRKPAIYAIAVFLIMVVSLIHHILNINIDSL